MPPTSRTPTGPQPPFKARSVTARTPSRARTRSGPHACTVYHLWWPGERPSPHRPGHSGPRVGDDGYAGTVNHVQDVKAARRSASAALPGSSSRRRTSKRISRRSPSTSSQQPDPDRAGRGAGISSAATQHAPMFPVEVVEGTVDMHGPLPALRVSAQPVVEPQRVEVRSGAHLEDDVAEAAGVKGSRWNKVDLVRDRRENLHVSADVQRAAGMGGPRGISVEGTDVGNFPQPEEDVATDSGDHHVVALVLSIRPAKSSRMGSGCGWQCTDRLPPSTVSR